VILATRRALEYAASNNDVLFEIPADAS